MEQRFDGKTYGAVDGKKTGIGNEDSLYVYDGSWTLYDMGDLGYPGSPTVTDFLYITNLTVWNGDLYMGAVYSDSSGGVGRSGCGGGSGGIPTTHGG